MTERPQQPGAPRRPVREEPKAPGPKLSPANQALEPVLREALKPFDAQVSLFIDEVVVRVKPEQVRDVCALAKSDPRLSFDFLRCLSVVDYPDRFEAVYHLASHSKGHKLVLKAGAPKDRPVFPSLTPLWRGANWYEREGAELFGVTFEGHPDPRHLLLFDEFDGQYPGRKDYPFAEIYKPPETLPRGHVPTEQEEKEAEGHAG